MRVIVVEDELPARAKLLAAIAEADPGIEVAAALEGVCETVEWLQRHEVPDLMFLDIQLSDGQSFEILKRARVDCPAVFVTAFDEYLLSAFETNGIDYVLKPVRKERIAAAVAKYRGLREHFKGDHAGLIATLSRPRERFLIRKGLDYVPVKISDVAYIYTEDKLVFLVTRSDSRHLLDKPLSELEGELDSARFFRANRGYLVSIEAVARCRPYGKGRLLLELQPPAKEEVVVSQERGAALRAWLGA
jgi:two-component system LytT family response regulator